MYVLFLKMFGVMLLVMLAAFLIALGIAMIAFGTAAFTGGFRPGGGGAWMAVIPLVIVAAFYLAMPLILGPYVAARTQNLFWDNTRSQRVAFQSNLTFRSMFRVNLVNLLLIVITLGLYWPFAKVRTARVKLEAIALQMDGDVEQWLAQAQKQEKACWATPPATSSAWTWGCDAAGRPAGHPLVRRPASARAQRAAAHRGRRAAHAHG